MGREKHDNTDIASIEAKITKIRALNPGEARALWRETFKKSVPISLTHELLLRILCWNIQEQAYGGHSSAVLKLLASYARGRPSGLHGGRRLKPGTEIVREFQGERYTVVITAEGFRWRDEDYSSLTAIARAITGTNWNGPRFFGLREGSKEKGEVAPSIKTSARPKPARTAGAGVAT